ncbi:MAG TPA: right-handed parallel beta-helix repeat-containing protein [Jatrophihabitantaceae bacterium]
MHIRLAQAGALVVAVPLAISTAVAAGAATPAASTTIYVTNTSDSGTGSLRDAILEANDPTLAWDTIAFNINGSGQQVITPVNNLPAFTAPVTLDGYTQSGASPATEASAAVLNIVIDARNTTRGLALNTNNSYVRGLVITGSRGNGIDVNGKNNRVDGNYVGLTAAGTAAGNGGDGIQVSGTANIIGAGDPSTRNVVSANEGAGVEVVSGRDNAVAYNYVGTGVNGTSDLGNGGDGVLVDADDTIVDSNIIGGNGGNGVLLQGAAGKVVGNQIGVSSTGTLPSVISNDLDGVRVAGADATIGEYLAGNTIGANLGNGIRLASTGASVAANYVGTDDNGQVLYGNLVDGVRVDGSQNVIGGPDATSANVVSGNDQRGVHVVGNGNQVLRNLVGTAPNGLSGRPNFGPGIQVDGDRNQISDNTAAFNDGPGIEISLGLDDPMTGNSVHDNTGLGIDLAPLGSTANDVLDGDAGSNDVLNYPVVRSAVPAGTGTQIRWAVVRGLANTAMQLEFFASDACVTGDREGARPLGTVIATTDPAGNARGTVVVPGASTSGEGITATATLLPVPISPTSELSACVAVS